MLKTLLVFLWILFAVVLSAKTLTKMNFPMNGSAFVINGSTNPVTHYAQLPPWENWSAFQNTPQKFYSFTNTIELDQLESIVLPIDFCYTLEVKGVLKYKVFGSTAQVTNNITLKISSDTSQKTSRRLDYYTYSNAYESEFDIQAVTLTTTQTGLTQSQLYDTVSKAVELNFGIQETKFLKPVYNTIPALQSQCVDNATDELIVSWAPVDFAEEYELEITFKDNYTNDINTALPASAITFDFKENSTRIVTKQNYYRIPLVYERGYLLFRVRAVGMGGAEWDKRIPCAWSAPSSGNVGAFTNKYGPIASHVGDKMNWQLRTTYSDEGKRKDVVQYFDGLDMSRQTVTGVSQVKNIFTQNVLDNSTIRSEAINNPEIGQTREKGTGEEEQNKNLQIPSGSAGLNYAAGIAVPLFPFDCTFYGSDKVKEIIAEEVIYDFNGRPALQILPAPTGTHKITYIKKLNKNLAGDSYSWKDFDIINNCLLTAHPLSDDASGNELGAGAYYSPKNPNKLGYNAFIPDSKGYPFSRVQYTFDNTGRTYRKAGIGAMFTMDIIPVAPGHETKFYYAKPNQPELDRMFGNEVGYAIRYQKNMVVDPNGQVSVSYLNPEGKTIATSLAGVRPDNLMDLDNENYPPENISVDLMASNITDSLEHSLTINEQFVVPQETQYTFSYNVNGSKLDYTNCANNHICLDCIYDIDISLIANEGCDTIPLFNYSGTFGDLVKANGLVHTDLMCLDEGESQQLYAAKPVNFPSSFSKILAAGSYTLIKTLKVNKSAADAYVSLVFKDTCQSVLQEFLNEEIAKIDTMSCYQSCSACKDSNASASANCNTLCPEPMNVCDQAKHMMLVDVSPGGQYAQYDVTSNGYDASNYPLSIFNLNNVLPNHPNWQSISGTTDLQSLILNWDKNASPIPFLPYHPEYCMLQWCDNVNTGKDYDLQLEETTTFAGAVSAGLLNITSTDPAYKQLLMNDPFFHTSGGALTNTGNTFLSFLTNPCGNNESVLKMAMDAAYCQSQPGYQNIISNIQASTLNSASLTNPQTPQCSIPSNYYPAHTFGSDPATKDLEWSNLRDLYRTFKEKYLYESRRDYSISNGCFNGCIGAQNYFFSPTPLSGHNGRSYSVEGTIPVNSSDLCGITEGLYNGKVKRFTNRFDAFSHMNVNLSGIDLYSCLTPEQISGIQSQIGSIVSQYVCDTCLVQSSNGKPVSCWMDDFTLMLNQYLPLVTTTHAVTLSQSQIASSIKNLWLTTLSFHIVQIKLEYIDTNHEYRITFLSDGDSPCYFSFPAKTYTYKFTPTISNIILIPPSSVCCVHTINPYEVGFTLQFPDNSILNVVANTKCKFPLCQQPGTSLPCDTCSSLNPLTPELFAFLNRLKQPNFPQHGAYIPQGNDYEFAHLLSGAAAMQYAMNPGGCTLTLSTGVSRLPNNLFKAALNQSKLKTANDITAEQTISRACTITFSDCNWLSSAASLDSIKPDLTAGQTDAATNEFILTYVRLNGNKLDTLTTHGKSSCFSINDCRKPYFCDTDSMLQTTTPPNNFNGCVQAQLQSAKFNAYSLYGKWLDSMKNDLRQKYYAKCMQPGEQMQYKYTDQQFHYTLYYYDQAGNLVRTVPPAGVRLLPASDAPVIDNNRDNPVINGVPVTPILPNHLYITNYAYNSLNQIRWQITPDAGRTDFWYDKLGRIAASQNAIQSINHDYSYSWYDKLGRIVESGKIHLSGLLNLNSVSDYNNWKTYLYGIPDRTEITYTQYDLPFSPAVSTKFGSNGQQNLRDRVASIMSFANKAAQLSGNYRYATHYTYDVTGNVPIVIQSYPGTPLGDKVIAYNFDLLSGKVNEVRYEPGLQDEFRHKYSYDDELRLVNVQTSAKGIVWETDAEYSYYKHGPLARMELGQLKVQGLDYIYTLQGWIKAVNGTTQDRSQDAGADGIALHNPKQITTQINGQPVITAVETDPNYNSTGSGYHSIHSTVAADAFGYVLGYYNDANFPDYTPIDPTISTTLGLDAIATGDMKPLYNGNISRMYTWLQTLNGLGMNYRYDRLNRLKKQEAFTIASGSQNLLAGNAYGMELSYDGSGNIITLKRNGRPGNTAMDDLTYRYYDAGNNEITNIAIPPANATNRLASVGDAVSSSNYPESSPLNGTVTDIDDQNPKNYNYDAIGNLISDNSEHINQILWNLQNKITGIAKTDGTEIDFAYDAFGNRVYKKFAAEGSTHHPPYTSETYYVRDAKGNVLATYEIKNSSSLRWQEANIYGVNRLGVWHPGIVIAGPTHGLTGTIDWQNITVLTAPVNEDSTIRGSKQYELSNHLGNVLATISDRRMQTTPAATGTSGTTADLISATDYYAFGMQMPGRNFTREGYRFGFNGKENDNDVKGDGNQQDYGMRIYDTRIGKFLSIDPISAQFAYYSPYQYAGNTPIVASDLDGMEDIWIHEITYIDGSKQVITFTKGEEGYESSIKGLAETLHLDLSKLPKSGVYTTAATENEDLSQSLRQFHYNPSPEIIEYKESWFMRMLESFDRRVGNLYGLEGFRRYGKLLDKVGGMLQKTPLSPAGELMSVGSKGIETYFDFKEKPLGEAIKNVVIRSSVYGAGKGVDKLFEKIKNPGIIQKGLKKAIEKGLDKIEEKGTEEKSKEKKGESHMNVRQL